MIMASELDVEKLGKIVESLQIDASTDDSDEDGHREAWEQQREDMEAWENSWLWPSKILAPNPTAPP